jgi:UDP-N-acetylmuramate--alanine ligase
MKHKIKTIHFVGIGGSGMSGIAEVLLNLGYTITGSDASLNGAAQRLISLGAKVWQGHVAEQIVGADCVVTSTAIKPDNPEVLAARAQKIPVIPRAVMLAELMKLKQGIAIAGTHGKTTTTSLVASVLGAGGLDPTFVIGGRLNSAGANAKLGKGDYFVVEADESDASFLNLNPVIAVVTNIDADHMETYGHDLARLKQAFVEFIQRLPFYGSAILCLEDAGVREIIPMISKPIVTYGFTDQAMVQAIQVREVGTKMAFTVLIRDKDSQIQSSFEVLLNCSGRHNVLNALATIAVALEVGVCESAIQTGLSEFNGVGRRFQNYGTFPASDGGQFTVIDDYGHHPVEMAVTLAAARGAFPKSRLVLAFQPHRFTRTRDLFEDFVRVMATADVLLLGEVYPAGETPIVAADGRALARALRVQGGVDPIFVEDIANMAGQIARTAKADDVVLTMGAGSIGQTANQLLSLLKPLAPKVING